MALHFENLVVCRRTTQKCGVPLKPSSIEPQEFATLILLFTHLFCWNFTPAIHQKDHFGISPLAAAPGQDLLTVDLSVHLSLDFRVLSVLF